MNLKFDLSSFARVAKNLGAFADQIPYALAQAMNDAAEVTRKSLIENTWPTHVQARNRTFMKAALTTKGGRATKRNLRIAIVDRLGRANLPLHARGGQRSAKGGKIAIPSTILKARRTGKGVPKGLRPRMLPNSFLKGDSLYQRVGPKGRKLKLMYTLKPSVRVSKDVPFEADFTHIMRQEVFRAFGPRLRAAMATRR